MRPKGWKKQAVEDCADLLTGNAFRSEDYVEAGKSAVRLLRGDNIIQGSLRWDDAKHWGTPYAEALQRYEMRAGDIVLAMDRPIVNAGLKCSVVRQQDLPSLLVQRVARLRAKKDFDQGYLAHVLQTHRFIEHLRGQKTETAVPHISPNDIREFEFLCPINPDEQHRIAQILSTWDQAIATAERLLANSRRRCDAAIEKLTIPNGDVSSWITCQLGALGSAYAGLSGKSADDFGDGVSYVPYMRVFGARHVDVHDLPKVRVAPGEKQNKVLKGDILFTTSSETPQEVGMSSVVLHEVDDLYLNSFCFGYRLHTHDILIPAYAAFLLRSRLVRAQFAQLAQGSTRFNISKGAAMGVTLHIPPPDEQQRRATILQQTESVVALETSQLAMLREEKAALMSQLLTGKRRVKLPEAEVEVQE